MVRVLLPFLCLLVATASFGQSQLLIISGGSLLDGSVFKDEIKDVYELNADGMNKEVLFAAATGDWNFAPLSEQLPATSTADVEAQIKTAASRLQPEDTLTIYLNDHGDAPTSATDAISGSVVLYGRDLSLFPPELKDTELLQMIAQDVPEGTPVKIVAQLCYSGGLNEIAFALPNVCSATSTDFRSMGYVKTQYSHGFWAQASQGKSLLESHFAGLLADTYNQKRGQTSSMAYVDKVLHEGPYNPSDEDRGVFGWVQRTMQLGGVWPTRGLKNPGVSLAETDMLAEVASSQIQMEGLPDSVMPILERMISPSEQRQTRVRLLQFLEKIRRFMSVATPEQEETLDRLLECEAQPL